MVILCVSTAVDMNIIRVLNTGYFDGTSVYLVPGILRSSKHVKQGVDGVVVFVVVVVAVLLSSLLAFKAKTVFCSLYLVHNTSHQVVDYIYRWYYRIFTSGTEVTIMYCFFLWLPRGFHTVMYACSCRVPGS